MFGLVQIAARGTYRVPYTIADFRLPIVDLIRCLRNRKLAIGNGQFLTSSRRIDFYNKSATSQDTSSYTRGIAPTASHTANPKNEAAGVGSREDGPQSWSFFALKTASRNYQVHKDL